MGSHSGFTGSASMIDILQMSFINMYEVIGRFLFFMAMLMLVYGGFQLSLSSAFDWPSSQDTQDVEFESTQPSGGRCSSKQSPPSTGSIRSWKMRGRR